MQTFGPSSPATRERSREHSSSAISANTGPGPPSAAKEERRKRVLTELRQARVTGIRVTLPAEALDGKLASLPEGVSVERDRIEVRFNGAKEAVERLYSLAYALVNDYERFEVLVDGGVGGGGECPNERGAGAAGRGAGGRRRRGSRRRPAGADRRRRTGCRPAVPRVLRGADREREDAGGVRAGRGAVSGVVRGPRPRPTRDRPAPRGRLHPDPPGLGPDGETTPGRDPHALRLARRQPGPSGESGGCRAGAETRRHQGRDAGPDPGRGEEAPRAHRHGHAGRPPRPGALLGDALQLRAGERGPGDEEGGLLPAGEPRVG